MAIPFAALAVASAAVKGVGILMDHKAQEEEAENNEEAAKRALRLGRRDLSIRSLEEGTAASEMKERAGLRADSAIGTARASAASAGVRGQSADSILSSILGDLGQYNLSVDDNLRRTQDQLDRHRTGLESQTQSRINEIQRPSLAKTALGLGATALDAYTHHRQMTFVPGLDPTGQNDPKDDDYETLKITPGGTAHG